MIGWYFYQMRHSFFGYISAFFEQLNARLNSCMFDRTPLTRNRPGLCTSLLFHRSSTFCVDSQKVWNKMDDDVMIFEKLNSKNKTHLTLPYEIKNNCMRVKCSKFGNRCSLACVLLYV